MQPYIEKFAIALLSPLGTGLLLSGLALLAVFFKWRKVAGLSLALGLVWVTAFSLPAVSNRLLTQLESQYPAQPMGDIPNVEAIVLLGGALSGSNLPKVAEQPINLGFAADRVWYAARLFHAGKAPLIVLSGGGYFPSAGLKEADAMAIFLADLGVPDAALVRDVHSRNTRENAQMSAALLGGLGIKRIILVTSAIHMARAIKQFRAQGLEVIAAPTDFEGAAYASGFGWIPDAGALDTSGRAIKEWVGQRLDY